MKEWFCILERTSKISKQPDTLVAGLVNILRFLYATEFINYEIYPQHPLHRAYLDTYLEWHNRRVTEDGLILRSDLAVIEDYFLKQDKLFLCGFDKCTLADIAAFFAIMPAHKDWLAEPATRDVVPKLVMWSERMSEEEEFMEFLDKLKLDNKAIGKA